MKQLITCLIFIFIYSISFAASYEKTSQGAKLTVQSTEIEVRFYSPEIVRIIKSPAGHFFSKESFSVIKNPETIRLNTTEKENVLQIESPALSVWVNLQSGAISFKNAKGQTLLSEKEASAKFIPTEKEYFRVEQSFLLDNPEAIYGLGQQQNGVMNYRGHSVNLQQVNTRIAIPFFQSIKGYGLFWDNYSVTRFSDKEEGTSFSSEAGDCIDYYLMYGQNMDGTIACMRDLTGQAPLFPLWTWGYWQSKERYHSQKETVGTLKRYRDLQIPIDGIIQDWRYWSDDNAYWNGIEFKNPEFPDPVQMMKDIHGMNAHSIISVWPSFGVQTEPYRIFKEKGMLFGFQSWPQPDSVRVYNVFDSKARGIYWGLMDKYIFSKGFDGWWLDATEPEYNDLTKEQLDYPTGLGSFREMRNAFPLFTVGGVHDSQRATSGDKRVYILTRSAFAGQQRYGANSWSGDTEGEWEVFKKQIPAGLNFSLSAIPYWNCDIGGFWVRRSSSRYDDYRELYVRWLQYGTFLPMMRSHGTSTPREIWNFGEKGDWAYDAIEKYIRLRYKLLPYHYAISREVTFEAGSVMRMLSMDFPNDPKVHDMGGEYMYGKSILVVPVTEGFYVKGEKENAKTDFSKTQKFPVYLPAGTDWYDFWNEKKIEGGSSFLREVPIDLMPLYVKAGSIIPFGPQVQYATETDWKELNIRVYPGNNSEFILYEDEFDNYNYEKGAYSTIQMQWDDTKQTLTIGDRDGSYPGMLNERTFSVRLAGKDKEIKVTYHGAKTQVKF